MPELPEMQALAERLHAQIVGATLREVQPLQFSALKTYQPDPTSLGGQLVLDVSRRGKYLVVTLSHDRVLVHLSQGGRVDVERPSKSTRPKGSVVRFHFGDDYPSVLIKEYGTERKAGWWVLGPGDEGPLQRLGPEPLSDDFADLITTGADGRRIHTLLRDQRTVAGIGRGHSDDILHRARLSPYAKLATLGLEQRITLLGAVRAVLEDALALERQRTGGLPTRLDNRFRIHGRAGTPCPECDSDLRRVSYESHEVCYCPSCQTSGKILADRRMSKLLR